MRSRGKQWGTGAAIICLALGPLASRASAERAANDLSRTKTILVFGDSLSDGFRLRRSEAYPALLIPKLKAAGLDYQVVNASQSGGTTDGGLGRLPQHLRKPVDIFVLELGINDAFRGTPIEQIRAN